MNKKIRKLVAFIISATIVVTGISLSFGSNQKFAETDTELDRAETLLNNSINNFKKLEVQRIDSLIKIENDNNKKNELIKEKNKYSKINTYNPSFAPIIWNAYM